MRERRIITPQQRQEQHQQKLEQRQKAKEDRARKAAGTASAVKPRSEKLINRTEHERIRIQQIRADGGTQMRAGLNQETVAEYAEVILAQKRLLDWPFPPLVVYYDGKEYWLADGFHRLAAFRKALGIDSNSDRNNPDIAHTLPAIVHAGDRRAAILHAAGANAAHGLRRTNADKRRSVETLLYDEEWRQWSDAEIGRTCVVDAKTVGNIRRQLEGNREIPDSPIRQRAGGATVNTSNVGSNQPARAKPEVLPMPETEIEIIPMESKLLVAAGFILQRMGDSYRYAWPLGTVTEGDLDGTTTYSAWMPHRADVFDAAFAAAGVKRPGFGALPASDSSAPILPCGQTPKGSQEPPALLAEPAPTVINAQYPIAEEPPSAEELAAIAIVEAEREEEDAERAARDRERAAFERVPVPAVMTFDAWLAAMPPITDLREHLAILELAKTSAKATLEIPQIRKRPDIQRLMYNAVYGALPTWSQLIIVVEKEAK